MFLSDCFAKHSHQGQGKSTAKGGESVDMTTTSSAPKKPCFYRSLAKSKL